MNVPVVLSQGWLRETIQNSVGLVEKFQYVTEPERVAFQKAMNGVLQSDKLRKKDEDSGGHGRSNANE